MPLLRMQMLKAARTSKKNRALSPKQKSKKKKKKKKASVSFAFWVQAPVRPPRKHYGSREARTQRGADPRGLSEAKSSQKGPAGSGFTGSPVVGPLARMT